MGWRGLAAAAVVLSAAGVARGGAPAGARQAMPADGVCELARVDRTRMSVRRCIACHDGTVGEGVSFDMRGDRLGLSHPVDVDYDAAASRRPEEYVPRTRLPPEVPLVDGKVVCTSCHDGRSTEPHHVWNYEKLCTSCHVK